MSRFLRNIVLFIIPLLLINFWFYSIVYSLYLKEYEKVELNYKTYLLADSRGIPLLKKDSLHGFYNFSAGSDSYEDMERKLNFLIENSSIERLIITVDDHTLSPYREIKNNSDRSIYFSSASSPTEVYGLFKDKYINRFFPLLNSKGRDIITLKLFRTKKSKQRKKEKDWDEISEELRIRKSKNRMAYQFPDERSSEFLTKSLLRIIKLCEENNIDLYGIKLPLAKEFIKEQGAKSYGAEKVFERNDIKVLDYMDVYLNKDNFFFNQDHLNEEGGTDLTKRILKRLN